CRPRRSPSRASGDCAPREASDRRRLAFRARGVYPARMSSHPPDTVRLERAGAVLLITFDRPAQRNALNRQMWRELRDAFAQAQDDPTVHVVVVTGSGSAFSAGQDLSEMSGEDDPGFGAFMDCLGGFAKPLLAAVNGVGVGFGLTLLLHCDVVYIAEGARLRPPFVTLGVVPEAASSHLLPATIGWQRAAEALFTADWIDAGR